MEMGRARGQTHRSGHITRWIPWGERSSVGRPQQTWYDEIKRFARLNWYQVSQNRTLWLNMRVTYNQWIENSWWR